MDTAKLNKMLMLEASATLQFSKMTQSEMLAYLEAYPSSVMSTALFEPIPSEAALNLHLKKNALHEDLGIPADKKIPEKRLKQAERSRNPLRRKRAQMADNMRHWNKKKHAASVENASDWFSSLTPDEQHSYMKAHPNSQITHNQIADWHEDRAANQVDKNNEQLAQMHRMAGKAHRDAAKAVAGKLQSRRNASKTAHNLSRRFPNRHPFYNVAHAETASKPLAHAYVGDTVVGDVTSLRGKFVFTPAWDAGEGVPSRFSAPTPQEMKVQLAERGLRVETA